MTEFPDASLATLSGYIACVSRELEHRKRYFPKAVAAGRMPQESADHGIAMMLGVLEYLKLAFRENARRIGK